MSTEQKIGQIIHVGMPGKGSQAGYSKGITGALCRVLSYLLPICRDKAQLSSLTKSLGSRSDTTGIHCCLDRPGRRPRERIGHWGVEQFPSAMAMGQADEVMLTGR